MKLAGAYTLHAGREQVWPLIHNPAHLISLIPGCEALEQTAASEYRGRMQILVAGVAGIYTTCVQLQESAEPFTTRFAGEMSGPAGAIQGSAWFQLASGEDAATSVLTYEGQGVITGPLSRMDGRIAESVGRSLINQGLANLDRRLQAMPEDVTPTASSPSPINGPNQALASTKATASSFLSRLIAWINRLLGRRAR